MKISCGEEVAMENAPSYIALAVVKFEVKKDWKKVVYLCSLAVQQWCWSARSAGVRSAYEYFSMNMCHLSLAHKPMIQ